MENPQAFPSLQMKPDERTGLSTGIYELVGGMTLRDWFAGQALMGLRAHYGESSKYDLPLISYQDANAMLKFRKENPNGHYRN